MRVIKYKAYWKKQNIMCEVAVINFYYKNVVLLAINQEQEAIFTELNNKALIKCSNRLSVPMDDVILLQFTGLHDKNGVEIYEGDVVKAKIHKKIKLTENEEYFGSGGYKREESTDEWTIEYKERFTQGNGFWCYGKDRRFNTRLTKSTVLNCNLEVIGNIHKNKESEINDK